MKKIRFFCLVILMTFCFDAYSQDGDQLAYELENLGSLNTRFSDFGAIPFEDGIILVSKRGEAIDAQNNRWAGGSFFDVYTAFQQDFSDENSYLVSQITEVVNSKFHDGPVSYDPTNKLLYFTRSNKTPFYDTNTGAQIFRLSIHFVKYEDGKWSQIQDFPYNEKRYSVGHPAVSSDGKRIFFVSDKPDGYGGTDIYMCEYKKGSWSEPVNLGNQVNTSRDEMFPFYHSSGRLYFASKGRNGLGGLDVFESIYDKGDWSETKNLGSPINSSSDDFAFYINDDFTAGLLSSNRAGGSGSDDIYKVYIYGSSYINEPDVVEAVKVEDVLKQAVSEKTDEELEAITNSKQASQSTEDAGGEQTIKIESTSIEKQSESTSQEQNAKQIPPQIKEKVVPTKSSAKEKLEEKDATIKVEQGKQVSGNQNNNEGSGNEDIDVNDNIISGRITDADGVIVSNATVEMYYGKSQDKITVQTDDKGVFRTSIDCNVQRADNEQSNITINEMDAQTKEDKPLQLTQTSNQVANIPRSNYNFQADEQVESENNSLPTNASKANRAKYTQTITEANSNANETASATNSTSKPALLELETATTNNNLATTTDIDEVAFRIQLGAFSNSRLHLFTHLKDAGKIDEYQESGLFKYLIGYYSSMENAEAAVDLIRERGVADAFIVGFQNGTKISKEQAQEYLE